ncbi:hypothetical protein VNO78_25867 [Psophocarpus tetragonolobus]|uniref:Squalene cyclase C-terminal domain-containing protein n=1 Tax=Psophocarpus tetragonolobus TaxID=3891 RepID=A0AAN9SAZ2_PSOTE
MLRFVKGLIAADKSYQDSHNIRKAREFLLSKQLLDDGWGESYIRRHQEVYTNLEGSKSNVVNTAWVMLALIEAGQVERDRTPFHREVKVLINSQLGNGVFPQQASMRFISKTVVLSLSILLLLPSISYSLYQKPRNNVKTTTFVSQSFEMEPGSIAAKTFFNVKFPEGHVGVKSFDAELVDEEGNSIPSYETYLHHWFAIKYHENITMSSDPKLHRLEDFVFMRNDGTCNLNILPHYWGFGVESRGTTSNIPDPFAIEQGNPAKIPIGYQEKWMLNIMAIDTRGAEDKKGCTECRCNLMNLPYDFYNVTRDIHYQPLSTDYKGGIFCCKDGTQCKQRKGFQGLRRKVSLRYKISWVDWNTNQVPVKVYILDSTDIVRSNGSTMIHDCQAEYTIQENNGDDSPHVQKANIPMDKGGYLIYGTAHMHSGVVNATLYGQDGRTLCTSRPIYGTGEEAGNEDGYLTGMSVCYPQPGSIKIRDGETLTLESRYKNEYCTGAMAQFYIYLAEELPQKY